MPLKKGSSPATFNANVRELMTSKAGKTRAKGIDTLAKRLGIGKGAAKQKQAIAISYAQKRK